MKTSLIALLALFSANSYALTITAEAKITQKVVFSYQDKKTVVKRYATATGNSKTSVDGVLVEVKDNISFPLDTEQNMKLMMLDKKSIHLQDDSDGISQVTPAKIKTKFGRLSKVVIKSEVYKALYSEQLQSLGVNLFGTNSISSDDLKLEINLNLSDFVCDKVSEELVCTQDLSFSLFASDEFMGKAELFSMLDNGLKVTESYKSKIDVDSLYDITSFNTVLREIDASLKADGIKRHLSSTKSRIEKLKKFIQNDIYDNYRYNNIDGATANKVLADIKKELSSIYDTL